MPRSNLAPYPPANRLLAALPKKEYQRMQLDLKEVALIFGEILYNPGEVIRHVYFPTHGIVSLLTQADERSILEVGIVGCEGMVGISVFLGSSCSLNRALVQGAGMAMRMKVETLRKHIRQQGTLQKHLLHYTHSLLIQVSQTAACNRFHTVNERLARWLMMTYDRLQTTEFRLTQEFLSDMLGVRREGVTAAARVLQRKNMIRYVRGQITILNLTGLEAACCRCYGVVKLNIQA